MKNRSLKNMEVPDMKGKFGLLNIHELSVMKKRRWNKKLEAVFLSMFMLFSLTACVTQKNDEELIWLVKSMAYDDHSGKIDMMEFEYDEQGRTLSDSWYVIDSDGNKTIYTKYTYTYERRGDEIRCIQLCPNDATFETFFDEDGKMIRKRMFSITSKLIDITTYYYHDNGKIKKEVYNYCGNDGREYQVDEYDEQGILIRESTYDINGLIKRHDHPAEYAKDKKSAVINENDGTKMVYKFDENGNKIKETKFDSDGQVIYESAYDYISIPKSSSAGIPRHIVH